VQAIATWRKGREILLEDGRAHAVVVDLRPEDGGTSAGTTPLELSLLSLAGSLTSTFVSVARKRRLDVSGLSLVLEEEATSASAPVGAVRGSLRVRSRSERAEVDATLQSSLEQCPVSRLFREAHIPLNVLAIVSGTTRVS